MSKPSTTALLALLLTAGPAWADDEDRTDESTEDVVEATVGGKRVGGLDTSKIKLVEKHSLSNDRDGARYSERVRRGAAVMNADEDFVADCIDGIELLYKSQYKEAKDQFAMIGGKYPYSGAEPVGQVLVWQALMLENFDFKYIDQYELAAKRARMQLEEALFMPGNEAWEHFLLGGVLGIDAIHTMRTGEYLKALNRGIEAMKSVNRAKDVAPEFVDAYLGDGLFNYWRTVIAKSSKAIPDVGDKRAEGISQMQQVEREGIFLSPAATLAMVFTWMEEGDMGRALAATKKNQRLYPDNVINNLVLGRVYMYMKRYDDSESAFKDVIARTPNNERVHYYLARLYMRTRQLDQAEASVDHYLTFDLDDESRGYALYQKGLVDYRRKDWAAAENSFKESWKLAKLDRAKKRLDTVKEKQKAGG